MRKYYKGANTNHTNRTCEGTSETPDCTSPCQGKRCKTCSDIVSTQRASARKAALRAATVAKRERQRDGVNGQFAPSIEKNLQQGVDDTP